MSGLWSTSLLETFLLTKRQRRAMRNCQTLEVVVEKLMSDFGSTPEALNTIRQLEMAIMSPEQEETQRELIKDYPNVATALRAWNDLLISEFQTREFPMPLMIDHLNGLEIVLRRIRPKTDEEVLRVLHRLKQTKLAIMAACLTAENEVLPLQALSNSMLAIQLAKLAATTPSARPDWLPEAWRGRTREALLAAAQDLWIDGSNTVATAPNWSARLKLYFLTTLRWQFEHYARGRKSSSLRRLDWAFDQAVKLGIQLVRDPIEAPAHPEINMIVRQQLARLSRAIPEIRSAIMNTKSNARSLDKPNTSHLEQMDVDRQDSAPAESDSTSSQQPSLFPS